MKNLGKEYPWAKFYHLREPLQIDEIGNVLDEIWATHSQHRRERSLDIPGARLIGETDCMREIRDLIEKVAPSTASVLIRGESGTGKEVVARSIHEHSGRSGDFVAVNCGAIPDNLLESELFGHEKGAFTGAHRRRIGQFEQAAGGTIFLDEIGDMPANMQVKLLRVLQEKVIERVGGADPVSLDVRVIAATHQDLQAGIATGDFREDLYYRLAVFPIDIPPLRERIADLPLLVAELVRRLRVEHRISISLSDEAMDCLMEYAWPGNVRELANLIERLSVIKSHGTVSRNDLPRRLQPAAIAGERGPGPELVNVSLKQHLSDIERELILEALDQSGGVVARAANLLGVGRTTLVEKMRRYRLGAH